MRRWFAICLIIALTAHEGSRAVYGPEKRFSYSLSTWSPTGSLLQVEHALAAVQSGAIAVGVSCNGGAVLVSLSPSTSALMREVDPEVKIAVVTPQAAMTYAGLAADFRVIVNHARTFCASYSASFGEEEPPTLESITSSLAQFVHQHTLMGGVRPFGCGLLVGGDDGSVWRIDPSGVRTPWRACAIGRGSEAAIKLLSSDFKEGLSEQEAEDLALRAITCACGAAQTGSGGTEFSPSKRHVIIKHIRRGFGPLDIRSSMSPQSR